LSGGFTISQALRLVSIGLQPGELLNKPLFFRREYARIRTARSAGYACTRLIRHIVCSFFRLWLVSASIVSAQVITTIAGTAFTFPSNPLPATGAPLGHVEDVAADRKGGVWVRDQDNALVLRIGSDGVLTVFAGNGTPGFSGDGGSATSASIMSGGIAADSVGNIYIAETAVNRVRKIANGVITTVAGNGAAGFSGDGGPATAAALNAPTKLAVDSAGNLYIADSKNNRIRKVSSGTITTFAGNGSQSLSGDNGQAINAGMFVSGGIAFDSSDNLYIVDGNLAVRRVSSGNISTVNGSTGLPGGAIALDSSGAIYLADANSNKIRKIASGVVTTVAGTGDPGFAGDKGSAAAARLSRPAGLAIDASGNLFIADYTNKRVRVVTNGTITTFAGNGGFSFSGDNGKSTAAALQRPQGVAADSQGNLYIADTLNGRIRKISNTIITTVAGTGATSFTGDGGPATSADLFSPTSVAVDAVGNLYIADTGNARVRRVSGGTITTIAGNGNMDSSGDGGSATNASVVPSAIAVDTSGNLFIADAMNNNVRRVSNGVITLIAGGNPNGGFGGDGGDAKSASLNGPSGIAVDTIGNIFIADTNNGRIRKVSSGTITTVAGNGGSTFTSDGGPPTGASLNYPNSVAVDAAGDLYIGDTLNNRVRRISNGVITTFAGNGTAKLSGDGGPAIAASLSGPQALTVDPLGNLYIADTGNDRVRKVLSNSPTYQLSSTAVSLTALEGGAAAIGSVKLSPSVTVPLNFTTFTSANWLTVNPAGGTMPISLQIVADPSGLGPGMNTGTITITAPDASPASQTITVTFTVSPSVPAMLSSGSANLGFSFTKGAAPSTQQLILTNTGSGSIRYSAAANPSTSTWLGVSPANGSVTSLAPVPLSVTVTPGNMTAGTYSASIVITSPDNGQQISIPVTLAISAPPQKILLSQFGFTFTAVAQGASVLPPQALGILNAGSGVLNYNVQATAAAPTSGWLSVSSASGTVTRPFLDVSYVNVIVNPQGLAPGTYFGKIQVTSAAASNSPQTAVVVLNVLQPGSNPAPDVQPTGLVFTGAIGASPSSQNVAVANLTSTPILFGSSVSYVGAKDWIAYKPTDASISPNAPVSIVVQPDFSNLGVGPHRATLTLTFGDGSYQAIRILAVVAPAGSSVSTPSITGLDDGERFTSSNCAPTTLLPLFTQVGGSNVTGGFPSPIAVKVVDDCGNALTDGTVSVSFSSGDAPLPLLSLQDGNWTGTWTPTRSLAVVSLVVKASPLSGNISGTTQASIGLQQASQVPPLLSSAVGVASRTADSFAPGDLILLKGTGLANGIQSSTTPQPQLAGASLLIAGHLASLLYADTGQVIGMVPPDVPVNQPGQVLVQRDTATAVPVSIIIAPTHPGILTKDGSGAGQGLVYKGGVLADASNPVYSGDTIIIYCTGLGATDATGAVTNAPTVMIGGQSARVTYAGLALDKNYPSGGAPTLLGVVSSSVGGLYQITAVVPSGVAAGPVPVILSSAGQSSQPGVTLTFTGGVAPVGPSITSIDTAGGFPDITQNDYIEIKGTNLASSIGTPDSAAIQTSGKSPTLTNGVSVTVNGKPAFVYYVSPAQVNVLTPLDDTIGPVQVLVTSNGIVSAPFTVNMRNAAPSLLLLSAAGYVTAQHADGTLLGPASLYPGVTVPAKPSETILMYGVGFGLLRDPIVNGAYPQNGVLPTLPVVKIGGIIANVLYAGVNGYPGLYQLNVTVPAAAPDGDNPVTITYAGQSTPAGELISVQK
jgi:uncharacterized protein (TIGR03437 family)